MPQQQCYLLLRTRAIKFKVAMDAIPTDQVQVSLVIHPNPKAPGCVALRS